MAVDRSPALALDATGVSASTIRHEAQRVPGLQLMVQQGGVNEVEIDGRSFWVRPVSPDVLRSGNVVATALAESLDKPFPWDVGFGFGNTKLSMELWTTIAGISGFDD